jgi:hypothetical protein
MYDALRMLTLANLIVLVLIPSIVLLGSRSFTQKQMDSNFLLMLRVTPISTKKLVQDILAGTLDYLKPLRVISVGLLLSIMLMLTYWMGPVSIGHVCGPGCSYHIGLYRTAFGFITPLLATLSLGITTFNLYNLAASVGVWTVLYWRKSGSYVAGGIVLAVWGLIAPGVVPVILILWNKVDMPDWNNPALIAVVIVCVTILYISDRMIRMFTQRAVENNVEL